MPTLLIVDDEPGILRSLGDALGREGLEVDTAASLADARARLRDSYDFVLLDVRLPDGSGLDLVTEIRAANPDTAIVMMSGQATIDAAVQATRLGAWDFLEKPVSLERLLVLLRNAAANSELKAENRRLAKTGSAPLIGRSAPIRQLLSEIERAGASTARVLIRGEHGSGKELVARALHAASPRRTQPFVAVNCSAIPDELVESELFGHEKGAFTGAAQARRGLFEEADRGTLFLDEIGDLSERAQAKLLRVLQEGELSRLGGHRAIRVDVRVIAATNRDLEQRARTGAFRDDLYFRLAVIPIVVPPLRERREDIPDLIEHFARAMARESGGRPRTFSAAAVAMLAQHDYPGNVRELRNLVERLVIMSPGSAIGPADVRAVLPAAAEPQAAARRLAEAVQDFERAQIEAALAAAGGNVTQAATRLGLERSHLYKKMRKLGWRPPA